MPPASYAEHLFEDLIRSANATKKSFKIQIKSKWLKRASIVMGFLLPLFFYNSTVTTQYENLQRKKWFVERLDNQFKDYSYHINSILSDNQVTDRENEKLSVIKKTLTNLKDNYKQVGIQKDFTSLEKSITNAQKAYQHGLEKRTRIAVLDKEFNHYESMLDKTLVSKQVDDKQYKGLAVAKKGLNNLKNDYEKIGVRKDFTSLEKGINDSLKTYQIELEKKKKVTSLDIRLSQYKNKFEIFVANSNIQRVAELNLIITGLKNLKEEYASLSVEKDKIIPIDELESRIRVYHLEFVMKNQITLLNREFNQYSSRFKNIMGKGVSKEERNDLDALLDSFRGLKEKYKPLNAHENLKEAKTLEYEVTLAIVKFDLNEMFMKEKGKYTLIAQSGFPISEDNSLIGIMNKLGVLKSIYLKAGLSAAHVDELLENASNAIETIKLKKHDEEKVNYYASRLQQITQYVESKEFGLAAKEAKSLGNILEKEDFPSSKIILEQVKNFSYVKMMDVPPKYETRKISDGYYKEEWIPEKKVEVEEQPSALGLIPPLVPFLGAGKMAKDVLEGKYEKAPGKKNKWVRKKEYKTIPGYYKKEWVNEPQYETTLIQEGHYKKILVFPYSGKEIEDFVPLKK